MSQREPRPPSFVVTREAFDAVLFDLDGVVTKTAIVHATAWKTLFDDYLRKRAAARGEEFMPFDLENDYLRYVDGKPRMEGVRSFLASRGIELSFGEPSDPPDRETICGLGNRKNLEFRKALEEGVEVFPSSIALVHALRAAGIHTAMVSSSKNCRFVLEAAKIADLFDVRVDGEVGEKANLKGKPAPDFFLEAARRLGVAPKRAIVVEDAVSGVQAGDRGGFGCVIGVDRAGQARVLAENGATIVVKDLEEVTVE